LADALEAMFGAVFLDAGFAAARTTIAACYADLLAEADPSLLGKDAKTQLQEWLQARRLPLPEYVVLGTTGEAHRQRFAVECRVPALALAAGGEGGSRRLAEQVAASAVLALATASPPAGSDVRS
jgi:ribonuclease-3